MHRCEVIACGTGAHPGLPFCGKREGEGINQTFT